MPSLRCVSMAASLLLYALLTSCVFATQARALRRGLEDSGREGNGTWRGAGLVHYVPGGAFYGGHAHVRPAVSHHRLYSHSNGISSGVSLRIRGSMPRQPRLHPLAMAGGGSPSRSDLPDGVNKSDGAAASENANVAVPQVGTKGIQVIRRWTKLAKEMRRVQDADIEPLRSVLSKMRFKLENGWPVLVFGLTSDTRGGADKIQALSMIHFNMVPDRYGNIHYLAEELDLPRKPRAGETKIFVVELLGFAVKPTMASSQRRAVERHIIHETRVWGANMGCLTVLGRSSMLDGRNISTRRVDIAEFVVGDDDAGRVDRPGLRFVQLDATY